MIELLDIQSFNTCNRSCDFCPAYKNSKPKDVKKMSDETLNNLANFIKDGIELGYIKDTVQFCFNRYCEPFIDYKFVIKIIKVLKEIAPNSNLILHSNGDLATIEKVNKFMEHLDYLQINIYDDIKADNILEIEKENIEYVKIKNKSYLYNESKTRCVTDSYIRTEKSCYEIYNYLGIDSDGAISVCCENYKESENVISEDGYLGNVNNDKFLDVYEDLVKNKKVTEMRNCKNCNVPLYNRLLLKGKKEFYNINDGRI
jgi:hypothetical protein